MSCRAQEAKLELEMSVWDIVVVVAVTMLATVVKQARFYVSQERAEWQNKW